MSNDKYADKRTVTDLTPAFGPCPEVITKQKAKAIKEYRAKLSPEAAVEYDRYVMRKRFKPEPQRPPVYTGQSIFEQINSICSYTRAQEWPSQIPTDEQAEVFAGWDENYRAQMERRDGRVSLLEELEPEPQSEYEELVDMAEEASAFRFEEDEDEEPIEEDILPDEATPCMDGFDYTGAAHTDWDYSIDGERISNAEVPFLLGGQAAYWWAKKGGYDRNDMLGMDWAWIKWKASREAAVNILKYLAGLKYDKRHVKSRAERRAKALATLEQKHPWSDFGQGYSKDNLQPDPINQGRLASRYQTTHTVESGDSKVTFKAGSFTVLPSFTLEFKEDGRWAFKLNHGMAMKLPNRALLGRRPKGLRFEAWVLQKVGPALAPILLGYYHQLEFYEQAEDPSVQHIWLRKLVRDVEAYGYVGLSFLQSGVLTKLDSKSKKWADAQKKRQPQLTAI